MKQLWKYTHPQSLTYNFMQDPLLSGEVWVAWDHVARLTTALKTRRNDFVAFPAPKGPKGRGYMPVLAGLAIPKTAPNPSGAKQLIKWLDSVPVQAQDAAARSASSRSSAARLSKRLGAGLLSMNAAVKNTQRAKDALKSLLPIGLGAEGGNFNKVYVDTFTRIVRQGRGPEDGRERRGADPAGDHGQDRRQVLGARSAEQGTVPGEVTYRGDGS